MAEVARAEFDNLQNEVDRAVATLAKTNLIIVKALERRMADLEGHFKTPAEIAPQMTANFDKKNPS